MARLEICRGHLLNWYNTQTLEAMKPASVSSVDSGNLAASLYTLRMGAAFLLKEPLISPRLFDGFRTYWELLKLHTPELSRKDAPALPARNADFDTWTAWLLEHEDFLPGEFAAEDAEAAWWLTEVRKRMTAFSVP